MPVKVEQAQVEPPISFRLDVMPVFMKAECNRCHGAARGQDGFRLSLFGFDPEGDHYRLTRELAGRRINLALPRESMLITKATEKRLIRAASFSRKTAIWRTLSLAGWKRAHLTMPRTSRH